MLPGTELLSILDGETSRCYERHKPWLVNMAPRRAVPTIILCIVTLLLADLLPGVRSTLVKYASLRATLMAKAIDTGVKSTATGDTVRSLATSDVLTITEKHGTSTRNY